MKLTPNELAEVRGRGLHISEKCDGCGKVLNQSHRYTIFGKPEVYCLAYCRDLAFFGAEGLRKAAGKRTCIHCEGIKGASESPYCARCQSVATGQGEGETVEREGFCLVCKNPVSAIRQSRSETCSSKCKEVLKKRRQREALAASRRIIKNHPSNLLKINGIKGDILAFQGDWPRGL